MFSVESDETLFLLATSYYRGGKPNQAYAVLRGKGASCPQCRFLLAKCCMDLQKYALSESSLNSWKVAIYYELTFNPLHCL